VDPWWPNPSVSEFSRREAGRQRQKRADKQPYFDPARVIAGSLFASIRPVLGTSLLQKQPQQACLIPDARKACSIWSISSERRIGGLERARAAR